MMKEFVNKLSYEELNKLEKIIAERKINMVADISLEKAQLIKKTIKEILELSMPNREEIAIRISGDYGETVISPYSSYHIEVMAVDEEDECNELYNIVEI